MMRVLRVMRAGRRLWLDDRGEVTTNTLGFALTFFVTFFVFLMNVQLGQLFHRRDVVDHAAAIAADTAKKSYCMNEENKSATEGDANKAIRAVLDSAGGSEACKLSIDPSGGSSDPGARGLQVKLQCSFECKVPIAAQFMCKGGTSKLDAKIDTVAMGCDGKGS
ncbi:MAG: hypothetical protein JWO86_4143 [Myxococcaceae bacterium]|nr:hypothetical protein [Myxococcaceae bacterium]